MGSSLIDSKQVLISLFAGVVSLSWGGSSADEMKNNRSCNYFLLNASKWSVQNGKQKQRMHFNLWQVPIYSRKIK